MKKFKFSDHNPAKWEVQIKCPEIEGKQASGNGVLPEYEHIVGYWQMKSGRWMWQFFCGDTVVARSCCSYTSIEEAGVEFKTFIKQAYRYLRLEKE